MKNTLWMALCLSSLLMAAPVLAAEKAKPLLAAGQGYGMAGCGLGSILFGEQTGMIQIVAATTNGIYSHQTFAISSGTSNCTDAGGDDQRSASLFIEGNREALEKDVARGGGETVATLSSIMGCKDSSAFGAVLQKNYGKIFPSQAAATENVVQSIAELSQQACG